MTGKQLTPRQLRKANQARREAARLKQSRLDPETQAGLAAFNAQQKRDREWAVRLQEAANQCARERRTIGIEEHPSHPLPRRTAKFEYSPPEAGPVESGPLAANNRDFRRRLAYGSAARRRALTQALSAIANAGHLGPTM